MEISAQTFDRICRICLLENGNMQSLFSKMDGDERNLFEILAFTADIDVKLEDNLPKQVCGECESALSKADAFKRRCLDSDTILNNVYQNSINKGKTCISAQEISIKHENDDINQQMNNRFETANVTILGSRKSTVEKNDLLGSRKMYGSTNISFCQLNDSKLPIINEQPVKIEAELDFGTEIAFSDHYNDIHADTIELKIENLVKTEEITCFCVCGLTFTSKDIYQAHLKKEHCDKYKKITKKHKNKIISITKLGCVESNQKTPSRRKLNNQIHQKVISNDNPTDYVCKFCLRPFKTQSSLTSHLQIHETGNVKNESYQCSLCLRKFKKKSSLSAHIKRHEITDSIKHTCRVCKREFKYKAYLENHILTMHSKKNGINCEICSQSFSNEESLELHRESHKNEKKHQCMVCNKAFLMSCTLKEHMRTHTGEKPFLCSQCGRGFSQKTNLAQHMRRHQGLKPFKCENCEKRFVSKGELDAHNRKHSGAHPFVCDDCGNGFTTSSALVKHRRIHTGEKPYLCDLCPMRFAASGTLKNHRRTHTGERPFQCSYCEKAFVQRNDLISHIRCHTGEKPYVCMHCGQSFRKGAGLKSHIKMHDKEPVSVLQGVSAMMNTMPEQ